MSLLIGKTVAQQCLFDHKSHSAILAFDVTETHNPCKTAAPPGDDILNLILLGECDE